MTAAADTPMQTELCAQQMGMELAAEWQTIPGAIGQLDVNLMLLGCDASADANAIRGSWQSESLHQNTPPFTRAVRAATNAIIFRALPTVPISLNHPAIAGVEGNILSESGYAWLERHQAYSEQQLVLENARLLTRFRGGLALRGYSKRAAGRDMRQEFDEVMDSLWADNSDHDLARSRIVERIMDQAGLRDLGSIARSARRVQHFSQRHGIIPGLRRVTPTSFIPPIPSLPIDRE